MAVLVRSGQRSVPSVRRVLGAAGVPLEVAGDELPLAREAAAAPLLLALRVAVDLAAVGPDAGLEAEQDAFPADVARTLLLSPLGGLDPTALRLLGRVLRDDERAGVGGRRAPARPAAAAQRPAGPRRAPAARGADACSRRPVRARPRSPTARPGWPGWCGTRPTWSRRRAGAHEVLWALWNGTPWPRRLALASTGGGPAGRAADRDLDVVVALFDLAARDAERIERRHAGGFLDEVLEAQQIPADTLSERGVRGEGVRVLTAHRSKGLEWPVVVVVDVQEDAWPDLGHRGSLLQPDRLGADGPSAPPSASERLADERRLFYVAATRARRRLVVTAVDSPEDDGVRPSRFLAELGVDVVRVRDRPVRPLTLPALVAELRAVAADPDAAEPLRRVAADRLATLAVERTADVRAGARRPTRRRGGGCDDPSDPRCRCTPTTRRSCCPGPRSPGSRTARCGGSSSTRSTPRAPKPPRWASGRSSTRWRTTSGRGETPADLEHLVALVDSVWNQLAFEAPWRSALERANARDGARPVPRAGTTPSAAASCWAPSTASRSRSASAAGPCGCAARWTASRSTTTAPCTSWT